MRPKPVKAANTMGFKVMPPATAEVITALPASILQKKFFSLKSVVQLFIAVMLFVVVGVKMFQHFNRTLREGGVDVVEIESVVLGSSHFL